MTKTTPDGVHVSVGIGLMEGKPTVNMHVSDGEADIYCFVTPRMAWRLAADLIGKTISAKMPIPVVRAYRIMRGKNV
jgi:hypothetical protein